MTSLQGLSKQKPKYSRTAYCKRPRRSCIRRRSCWRQRSEPEGTAYRVVLALWRISLIPCSNNLQHIARHARSKTATGTLVQEPRAARMFDLTNTRVSPFPSPCPARIFDVTSQSSVSPLFCLYSIPSVLGPGKGESSSPFPSHNSRMEMWGASFPVPR